MVTMFLAMTSAIYAQTVTGTVSDETGPLPGANVLVKGTTNGTQTDFDGKFSLNVSEGSGTVVVSFVGYGNKEVSYTVASGETKDLGNIKLVSDNTLDEVVVVGSIIDVAKDRETPVAVSTIKAVEIQDKLGSQEFPEILSSTPSVYATKSGGGFGDARINIRGFAQENIAVMINGVPVNDMENSRVYWSNWAGLSDVTTAMQVQRGLGSSKLAISSVGGTINIVTKTTDKRQGGAISGTYGNDNYLKTLATYSTGKMDNGFAATILLSRTAGDGYVNGTKFEGYNYFLGFGLDKGDHNFQFTFTGAPQTHNQRTTSFYNMATIADYLKYGKKYNYNHGYLNGEEFNWRKNFYHKPVASLNWSWEMNERTNLTTALYASFGRGGGTGDIGKLGGKYNFASSSKFRNSNGEVLWDQLVRSNSGQLGNFSGGFTYQNERDFDTGTFLVNDADLYSGANPRLKPSDRLDGVQPWNGLIRRASVNSHNWFGLLTNLNTELNENLSLDFGVDLRSYKGIHYRRIDNLLGADGYRDNDNVNKPMNVLTTTYSSDLSSLWNVFKSTDDEQKIDYYNDGLVRWYGAFGQLEYKNDKISAFVQAAGSNQGFQRIDYFNYKNDDPKQKSEWVNILGGNIKAGLNYNIDEKNNIFFNAGYYSKQPGFDAIFLRYLNIVNEDRRNEKVMGVEVGYGFRSEKVRANINLYRTSWKDRYVSVSSRFGGVNGRANIQGVEQIHMGAELDVEWRPIERLRFNGMFSVGDWKYGSTVSGRAFDNSQNYLGDITLYLKDVKVGDAAQLTARLGFDYEIFDNFRFDISQRYIDKLYAKISAEDFSKKDHKGSLQLPGYSLVDAGISYKFILNKDKNTGLKLRLNVNNLANKEYILESATNYFQGDRRNDKVYNGINTANKAFFGFGRTWSISARYSF